MTLPNIYVLKGRTIPDQRRGTDVDQTTPIPSTTPVNASSPTLFSDCLTHSCLKLWIPPLLENSECEILLLAQKGNRGSQTKPPLSRFFEDYLFSCSFQVDLFITTGPFDAIPSPTRIREPAAMKKKARYVTFDQNHRVFCVGGSG